MHKRTKATAISAKVRARIRERDGGCIFCKMQDIREQPDKAAYALGRLEIMHFVNRSQGGLGIEENLAVGCTYHHSIMDNSAGGYKLRERMEEYLRGIYPNWDETQKTYSKW